MQTVNSSNIDSNERNDWLLFNVADMAEIFDESGWLHVQNNLLHLSYSFKKKIENC